jgi:hypothetical protein
MRPASSASFFCSRYLNHIESCLEMADIRPDLLSKGRSYGVLPCVLSRHYEYVHYDYSYILPSTKLIIQKFYNQPRPEEIPI